jgi:hypothetical protein
MDSDCFELILPCMPHLVSIVVEHTGCPVIWSICHMRCRHRRHSLLLASGPVPVGGLGGGTTQNVLDGTLAHRRVGPRLRKLTVSPTIRMPILSLVPAVAELCFERMQTLMRAQLLEELPTILPGLRVSVSFCLTSTSLQCCSLPFVSVRRRNRQ